MPQSLSVCLKLSNYCIFDFHFCDRQLFLIHYFTITTFLLYACLAHETGNKNKSTLQ